MGNFFQKYWALLLLSAAAAVFLALLFELSWPQAYVDVVTIPSSSVLTDGNGYTWSSPARVPVPAGGLMLTVTGSGHAPVDTLIDPDLTGTTVVICLGYLFQVDISTVPSGASLTLDGVHMGLTPVSAVLDSPGTHTVTLTLTGGSTHTDSFNILSNEPRNLVWVLPERTEDGLLLIRGGCPGTVRTGSGSLDTMPDYLISPREVTAIELLPWLRYLEPFPDIDDTYRWGRTELFETLFPGDYPVPFFIGPSGGWEVVQGMDSMPVAGICYRAALDYCGWLTEISGDGALRRLPTEVEWETAALAGGSGPWPWGSDTPDGSRMNFSDVNEILLQRYPQIDDGFQQAAPVGSYPPNGWGMYDMAGNLWEWCDPGHPDSVPVARGGSWLSSMEDCMCQARIAPDTSLGYAFIGFRVVVEPLH